MPITPRIQPLSRLKTIDIMIAETQNEITKCEVMESLSRLEKLRGNSPGKNGDTEMMMQTKIRMLKRSTADLETMYAEELKKEQDKPAIPTAPVADAEETAIVTP